MLSLGDRTQNEENFDQHLTENMLHKTYTKNYEQCL